MKKKIYATKQPGLQNKKIANEHFHPFLFIISLSASAQNPLLLQSQVSGGAGRSIQKIVGTASGKAFFNTVDNNNRFYNFSRGWCSHQPLDGE